LGKKEKINFFMAIFKKNKKLDEDEFDEEEARGGRKLTKKLRDLEPKNKKKRREPPKPWGKKERMIVFMVLAVSVIISAILAVRAQSNFSISGNFPRINLDSLNIFKEETIIVGNR